ncbi:MAG: hypothetical protein AAGB11_06525 [Pseudomonadota bacterium]
MHRDVEKWLHKVWNDRSLIMRMAPSYKNRGQKHHADDSINLSVEYISDLLGSSKGRQTSVKDEDLIRFIDVVMELAQGWACPADFIGGDEFIRNVNMSQLRDVGLDQIASRRFLLRRTNAQAPFRVFINVADKFRTEAFKRLFYVLFTQCQFEQIAVAAPGMERADAITVYTASKAHERDVVDIVRRFVTRNGRFFGNKIPPLSASVPGVQGIATATTPPEIQIMHMGDYMKKKPKGSQDFKTYRSQLVFMSLERCMARQSVFRRGYVDFKQRVTENFRKAGIDVNNPSEQGDTVDVLEPWELEHRRKWNNYNTHRTIMGALSQGGMGGMMGGLGPAPKVHPPNGPRKLAIHSFDD